MTLRRAGGFGYSDAMRRPKILVLILACSLLSFAGSAPAGELRRIVLTDGSVLAGEVVSYQDGVYTVRTDALGTISIDDTRIRSIRTPGEASVPPAREVPSGSVAEQMQSDEEIMEMIRSLKDAPDFRQVLDDPDLLRAVERGDLATLISDPRFRKLLEDPNVLEIKKKMVK